MKQACRTAAARECVRIECAALSAQRKFRRVIRILLLIFLVTTVQASASSYVYDAQGRLRAVTNSAGGASAYLYDAVGNLLQIQTLAAGQLALFTFAPVAGAVGSTVTIQGNGFSTTPASNIVKFNGVAATVTSATATQLTVKVPASATTGLISLTVASSTVTSDSAFTVTTDDTGLAPVVTGFTPSSGTVGTAVTVSGSHFLPVAGQTTVALNSTSVVPTSLTDTALTFNVPASTGTGKVQVNTIYGLGASTNNFTVLPPGVPALPSLVASAPLGGPGKVSSISLTAPNQYGEFAFDATAGDWLLLQITSLSTTPIGSTVAYTVVDPRNTQIASGSISNQTMTVILPLIHRTGTYQIIFSSGSSSAVSISSTLQLPQPLPIDGSALPTSTTILGQTVGYTFPVAANQTFGLAMTNLAMSPANTSNNADTQLYNPDGTANHTSMQGQSWYCVATATTTGGCSWDLAGFTQVGTYALFIGPENVQGTSLIPTVAATMSYSLTTSSDLLATLATGATANVTLTRPGQNERLTFSKADQQPAVIEIANVAVSLSSQTLKATILDPTGAALQTNSASSGGMVFYLPPSAVGGTYTLLIEPTAGATGSAQVTLDAGTTLPIDGPAVPMSTSVSGRSVRLNFTTTSVGQSLGLAMTGLSMSPANTSNNADTQLYNPDGTANNTAMQTPSWYCLASATASGGCGWNLANLQQVGTYTLLIGPENVQGTGLSDTAAATMGFSLTMSSDLTSALSSGATTSVSIARPGQNERLTFQNTAGQASVVEIANVSVSPAGQPMKATVLAPGGTVIGTNSVSTGGMVFYVPPAPTVGTYTVLLEPFGGATGSAQVTLDAGTTLPINGATVPMSATVVGKSVRLNFTTTAAGQSLGLAMTGLSMNPANTSNNADTQLYNPDGTANNSAMQSPSWYCLQSATTNGGCGWNLANLQQVGTYTLLIGPEIVQGTSLADTAPATMAFSLTISTDLTASLTAGATANVSITRPGQNERLTFQNIVGQASVIEIANVSVTPSGETMKGTVFAPSGSVVGTNSVSTGGMVFYVPPATTAGTYTVLLEPSGGATGSAQVTLDAGTALPLNGATVPMSATVAGKSVRLNFTTTAVGQSLGLGMTGLSMSPANTSNNADTQLYNPDGTANNTAMQSPSWYCLATATANGGCGWNLANLQQVGTYTLLIGPEIVQGMGLGATAPATMVFSLTMSTDLTAALTAGVTANVSITRPGQNERLTFQNTIGQAAVVEIANVSVTPAGQSMKATVFAPGGSVVGTNSVSTGGMVFYVPPATTAGTNTVLLEPAGGATGSAQVTLDAGTALPATGAGVNVVTTVLGRSVRMNFTRNTGQNFILTMTGLAMNPANSSNNADTQLYNPDGTPNYTALQSPSWYCRDSATPTGGCTWNITTLTQPGAYTLLVGPEIVQGMSLTTTAPATMSFTLTLSPQ